MPEPTALSPNTGNYQVGKGVVSFKKRGAADFRRLGNVTNMVITPKLETLEHFSSMEGVKKKDLVVVLEKKATVKLTMEEFTPENVGLMVLGDVDLAAVGGSEVEIFSTSSVDGHLRFVGTNEIGPKITVDLYNVSFAPDGDLGLITDEWNNMELTGDVLVGDTAPNVGKFGIMKWTNLTPPTPAAITDIAPDTGPAAGGTAVVITGTGLSNATGVTFGGTAGTAFQVISATEIHVNTPPHAAGAVAVVVLDPDGNATENAGFTYT